MPGAAVKLQQLHRHGIQHFVAQYDAVHLLGQVVQPLHLGAETRQAFGLAGAQGAGDVNDAVTGHAYAH